MVRMDMKFKPGPCHRDAYHGRLADEAKIRVRRQVSPGIDLRIENGIWLPVRQQVWVSVFQTIEEFIW